MEEDTITGSGDHDNFVTNPTGLGSSDSTPNNTTKEYSIAALYRFSHLHDIGELQLKIRAAAESNRIFGMLLLAEEGINGTISGHNSDVMRFLSWLRQQHKDFADMDIKYSQADQSPFYRMRVRLKREIVTMGRPDVKPTPHSRKQGVSYVEPSKWNALIQDPDVLLVRNVGTTSVGKLAAGGPVTLFLQVFLLSIVKISVLHCHYLCL
eukprot:m.198642 g.198642  ORF g.198642 m.198642 type:complete len:209 (+) comp18756_c0_seq1:240-866(+)